MKSMRGTGWLMLAAWTLVLPGLWAQGTVDPSSKMYLFVRGSVSGEIRGEVTTPGREDLHSVLGYTHEIVSPYDLATGLPTGRRQHHPFRVVKLVNRGSPLLMQALASNETLTEVRLNVWAPSATGKEVLVFTYTLQNARLVSFRPWRPNKSDAATAGYPPSDELAFVYESITITHEDGGITATDRWADSGT